MLPTLAALLALAAPVPAGGVGIKNKLNTGDVFYLSTTTDMGQTVTPPGRPPVEQSMKQAQVVRFRVADGTPGRIVVAITYLDAVTKAVGLPADPAMNKRLVGVTLTATLDDTYKVAKLDGYDKLLDALAGGDPAKRAAVAAGMPQETLTKVFSEMFGWVPGKVIRAGDDWTRADAYSLGPLGGMDFAITYTLTGVEAGAAVVAVDAKAKYVPPAASGAGGLAITAADLKADRFTGTQRFDLKAGRLKDSKMVMEMSGTMTFAAGGKDVVVALKQTLTTTSTVTADNPLDKK